MYLLHQLANLAADRSPAPFGLRDQFEIEAEGGADMHAHGNVDEYEIEQDGKTIATVSKKWFRIKETYGVEIQPDHEDALLLAFTVCIDAMT